MKKTFSTFYLFIYFLFCNAQTIGYIYLHTPNNTPVLASLETEMSPSDIEHFNNYYTAQYPNAEFLAPTSGLYNCHSWAWNMVEGGPKCWLGNHLELRKYWNDGSYVETTEKYAEKIVWFQVFCGAYYEDHSCNPNPTNGKLTIDNGQLTIKSVEVFDVYGRNVSCLMSHVSCLMSHVSCLKSSN